MDAPKRTPEFEAAREWLRNRWGQEWPNEAHCQMLAEYATEHARLMAEKDEQVEALQARVAEFENSRAYKVGVTVGKAAASREAFEEAAKVADAWYRNSGHGSPGDEIRALAEKET